MLNRVIKLKNGTEIYLPVDEWDMGLSIEAWEIAKKVLMPKLNLKEHKIIILETPSKKGGFFYDLWTNQ